MPWQRGPGRMAGSRRRRPAILLVFLSVLLCRYFWGPAFVNLPDTRIPDSETWSPEVSESHDHEASLSSEIGHLASHPGLFFGEVCTVVVLSLLFETWEHWVHHRIQHAGDKTAEKILAAVFKELTCLGFIGLFLFGATRCGLVEYCADTISPRMQTNDHVLLETFETVHMMIFFLLIVLIFQAVAVLHVAHNVIAEWGAFEHLRAFGMYKHSLESLFVDSGYLMRVPNPESPRAMDLTVSRIFVLGNTLWERLKQRHDYMHGLVKWRAIRHEFLFPSKGKVSVVPAPSHFSYSAYLRHRMTEVVLSLVELDKRVWAFTLFLPGPALFHGIHLTFFSWQVLLCCSAWGIFVGAVLLTLALEEDLHGLMPATELPKDPRQILVFFQGTSFFEMLQDIPKDEGGSTTRKSFQEAVKRGAPGFRSMGSFKYTSAPLKPFMFAPEVYKELLRILGFWQAIVITALATTCTARTPQTTPEAMLVFLTLVEWPVMLFWVVPVLIQRLTVRISDDVDHNLVRSITLDCKEARLRQYLRLVQFEGFFDRARQQGEAWAQKSGWSLADAAGRLRRGAWVFNSLPLAAQEEIGALFTILDISNDGRVYKVDIERFFTSMGFKDGEAAAEALVRLVEHDGADSISEEGFQAVAALATMARPEEELREDIQAFFDMFDKAENEKVRCYQITKKLRGTRLGSDMQDEDIASLLYKHFMAAKPALAVDEFVDWFEALGRHWQLCDAHGHDHAHD